MSTATCVISFGSGSGEADPFAVIELDDSRNRDSDGEVKTTFSPGETIWFLLHLEPGFSPSRVYDTDGQATMIGEVTQQRADQGVVFGPLDEDIEHELSYYPSGGVSAEWHGNSMTISAVNGRTLTVAQADRIARADLIYSVHFWSLRFDPPPLALAEDESYSIDVKITVEPSA